MTNASKSPSKLNLAVGFIAGATGLFLGAYLATSGDQNTGGAATKKRSTERLGAQPSATGSMSSRRAESPLEKALRLERHLMAVDPAEFPAMLEAELRNATEMVHAFRIATVWTERDPNSFITWLQSRPGNFTLREAGHGLGFESTVLTALAKEDPEHAWEVAGRFSGSGTRKQMTVLRIVLDMNPDRAVELVREHRDLVSLADTGYGFWEYRNPMTSLPILNELRPGSLRESIIRDSVAHYFEKGREDKLAESEKWYEQLTPELQRLAKDSLERRMVSSVQPEFRTKVLEKWSGVER